MRGKVPGRSPTPGVLLESAIQQTPSSANFSPSMMPPKKPSECPTLRVRGSHGLQVVLVAGRSVLPRLGGQRGGAVAQRRAAVARCGAFVGHYLHGDSEDHRGAGMSLTTMGPKCRQYSD